MRVKLDNSYERGGYSERVPERKVHALECWYCSRTDGIKSRTVSSPRRPGQTAGRSYERHLRINGDNCQSELNADLRQGPQKIDRPGPLILRGAAANGIVQLNLCSFPARSQRRKKYTRTDEERYEMRTFINAPVKPSNEDLGASARVRRPLHGCFRLRAERCKYWRAKSS